MYILWCDLKDLAESPQGVLAGPAQNSCTSLLGSPWQRASDQASKWLAVLAVNGEGELPSPLEPLQRGGSISPAGGDPKLGNSMEVQRAGPLASRQLYPVVQFMLQNSLWDQAKAGTQRKLHPCSTMSPSLSCHLHFPAGSSESSLSIESLPRNPCLGLSF